MARMGLAVGVLVAGLTLPPRLEWLVGTTPTPPLHSRSRYMETVDTARAYELGCNMGNQVNRGTKPVDALIILAFSKPVKFDGSTYGASVFNGPDQPTAPIRLAVQEFAHGYWACTDGDRGKLTIGAGTSNFGDDVTRAHGEAWAKMVNSANNNLKQNGWSSQVVVVGAIDLELSWSSPEVAEAWLDGYDSVNKYRVLNFGDAAGCPPATSSCGSSSHPEWTQYQVWLAAWGHPSVFPVPQIYRTDGIQAEQWHQVAHKGLDRGGTLMKFSGALTQQDACQERGCDPSIENTPAQGWTQLWKALNHKDGTDQNIKWSTDISWEN